MSDINTAYASRVAEIYQRTVSEVILAAGLIMITRFQYAVVLS
jgi:hypothetical protein